MIRIATDVGGTFTDFAAYDDKTGRLTISKASTTERVIEGVAECFEKSGLAPGAGDHFVHGNTLAINTVIQRNGAKVGLLSTEGFRDILELGRGNIPNSFNLLFATPEPLVPRARRLEVAERMRADASIAKPLDQAQALSTIESLLGDGVEAIAICLLHAYANPAHEEALKKLIAGRDGDIFLTASSDLLRQYREFERSSTTVLNAYVGPGLGAFLDELQGFLADGGFAGWAMAMQSSGGTMTLDLARRQPVRMMESGPVGGAIAAAGIGKAAGLANLVAFDMGGTTAKVSIVRDGEIEISDGYTIGGYEMGYPLQLPVVDVLEVGSGGGSIAHINQAGSLKVGPLSAGAVPGPACYGEGGARPTVTDADLVLGRLNGDYFLGSDLRLDTQLATRAIEDGIAAPLGLEATRAAFGIAKLADNDMAHAVNTMTVQKGHDPRDFTMVAFGGAGPGHAASVARELGIGCVVVPPNPGIYSAFGMLLADARDEYVLSYVRRLDGVETADLEARFAEMENSGRAVMAEAGFSKGDMRSGRSLEMRYRGQEFTLVMPGADTPFTEQSKAPLRARFDELYVARYGHAYQGVEPEIVSLRVHLFGDLPKPPLAPDGQAPGASGESQEHREVYFEDRGFIDCAIYRRPDLSIGAEIAGPAVIEEVMSTTLVHPGDGCRVDDFGNLVITLGT